MSGYCRRLRTAQSAAACFAVIAIAATMTPTRAQCALPAACGSSGAVNCPGGVLGQFCDGLTPFLANSSAGIIQSGGQLLIDQNCDGLANGPNDIAVPVPASIASIQSACADCTVQWRLTPSQDFAYARVFRSSTAVPGCSTGALRLYFFAIDPGPALTDFAGNGVCLGTVGGGGTLAIEPRFHDYPDAPVRTGFAAARAESGSQPVVWVDLVGRQVAVDNLSYPGDLTVPKFAPAGNAALLVCNQGGANVQWALVDLCADPLGGQVATGAPSGVVNAAVTGATGAFEAAVDTGAGTTVVSLGDCLCSGGSRDYMLSIDFLGDGAGRVRSADWSLNCTTACSVTYPAGTVVNLAASPIGYAVFTGWSGDCNGMDPNVSVVMTADRNCAATFVLPHVNLAITSVSATPTPLVAGATGALNVNVAELLGAGFSAEYTDLDIQLPAEFVFDAAGSDSRCRVIGDIIRCDIGTIASGGTDQVAIAFAVDAGLRNDPSVALTLNTYTDDIDLTNNSQAYMANVAAQADLAATLTAQPELVRPGGLLAYSIEITNNGPSTATNIAVSDMLPAEVAVLDPNGTPGAHAPCSLPDLGAGAMPLTITTRVNAPLNDGVLLNASVSVSAAEPDPVLSNNSAFAASTVDNAAAAFSDVRIRVIADPNTLMPNGVPGGIFTGEPALSNGTVAFLTKQQSGLGGSPSYYRWREGVMTTVADFNTRPPGAPDVMYNAEAPAIDNLEVALGFATYGIQSFGFGGVYTASDCGPSPHMQAGDPSPGYYDTFHGSYAGVRMGDGRVVFWDSGEVFLADDQGVQVIGSRWAPMPDGDGYTFWSYFHGGWDFDGEWFVFFGASEYNDRRGVYVWRNGMTTKIVDNTDPRPTSGLFDFLSSNVGVDDGIVAFVHGSSSGARELYIHDLYTGVTQLIADGSTPLPGASGRTFGFISDEVDVDNGRVLFLASGSDSRGYGFYIWEAGAIRRVHAETGYISPDALSGNQIAYRTYGVRLGTFGDPGDLDLDGAVDGDDAAALLLCIRGADQLWFNLYPNIPANWYECLSAFDQDLDDDLDMADFATLSTMLAP